jgi:shikimate dehydrogenase
MARRFVFVGVTTSASSIVPIFPRWRDALGLGGDVELEGWDLPVGAPAERYREAVARLRAQPDVVGALVTTHKLGLFEAAADLFDELDVHARRLREVSCIARRDGRLLGWAKDALSAGRALEELTPMGYFAAGGHALVLGAGGAGGAIVDHLLGAAPPPSRVIVTDTSDERLGRFTAWARTGRGRRSARPRGSRRGQPCGSSTTAASSNSCGWRVISRMSWGCASRTAGGTSWWAGRR